MQPPAATTLQKKLLACQYGVRVPSIIAHTEHPAVSVTLIREPSGSLLPKQYNIVVTRLLASHV